MRRANRRKHVRLSTLMPVILELPEGRRVRWARNLSIGGLQLAQGPGSLEPGAMFDMQFRLPDCPVPVCCSGEVVYGTQDSLGVRFTRIDLLERAAVSLWGDPRPPQG